MTVQGELPAEAVHLNLLQKHIETRRLTLLEKIGSGSLSDVEIREHIGRAKEDKWLADVVATRLKQLHTGDDA